MAMMASSSSAVQPPLVFINFRGEELRNGFVSHLVTAFTDDGINVYIDEKETRGEDMDVFFEAIEKSKIALAIFSSKYSESNWCLDELVKIKERVDLKKLVVLPIFFKVGTDDVADLKGVFSHNFWELAKRSEKDGSIDRWRTALEGVTKKLGLVYRENSNENEADFLKRIVRELKKVITKVSKNQEREIPVDTPGAGDEETTPTEDTSDWTAGIKIPLQQLEEKLDFDSDVTVTIGVVGMPGIGKKTLAKEVYKKWHYNFVHHAFFGDVHALCRNGIVDQRILEEELLKGDEQEEVANPSGESVNETLLKNKSLIVLANLSDKTHIEILLGKCDWLMNGSKIIITTSDMSVIEGKVDDTYEVLRLDGKDSMECFNYHAFGGKSTPEGNFMNLSKSFVDYAKGNPFALTTLGKELYLYKNDHQTLWGETLSMLAQIPNEKIRNFFQRSYDGLSLDQQNVFLDIACFFRSGEEYYVRCLVETCDTKSINGPSEIKDLASKFLINICGGRVEMHELLYSFGKALGTQSQCWLWDKTAVLPALRKKEGADRVRGIFLDMSELKAKQSFNIKTLTRMCNLRYLKFYSSHCHQECEPDCNIIFPGRFTFPMGEMRYLYWLKFPWPRLPNDFKPNNLIDLNLPYSKIEEVWEEEKNTPKLKWVDLSHSIKLCSLSGLQNAEHLQRLNLEGCTSLKKLPVEMNRMKSLIFLNLRGCTSLLDLPRIDLVSLETLILSNCSSLKQFWLISNHLETLHLDGTAISQLPPNMAKLQRLIVLNLKECKNLRAVPESLGKLKALQELVLSGCSKLKSFPIPIENMKRLQILMLDETPIKEMPKILQFNSSKVEDLRGGLRHGMKELSSLRRLCLSKNDKISNLQINMCQLHHLKLLDLKYCKNLTSLPLLPANLEILDAHGCEKLKTVASPMATLTPMDQVHSKFIFTNCNNLEQVAKNSITSYAQRRSQLGALRCYEEENVSEALFITSFPGSEVPSWFNHRAVGSALKLKFPTHWCANKLSTIVLCAVVAFKYTQDQISRFSVECTCEFKNGTVTCLRFTCNLGGGWIEPRKIDSDHVFIGYTSSSHLTKHLEGSLQLQDNHRCVPTDASFEFKVVDGEGEIVNCGLSLVYEEPQHVAVEGNHNQISSRSDVSVGNRKLSFAARFLPHVLRFLWIVALFFLVYGCGRVFIK